MFHDITVFGRYTYLATEVLWGAVALALLYYADAFRTAARTVAVLYPFGFVWDWYTLEVGVFAIPMRTGVEFLGIPVEEHVFIVLVPAMVVGVHESLRKRFGPAGSGGLTGDDSPTNDDSPTGDDSPTNDDGPTGDDSPTNDDGPTGDPADDDPPLPGR